MPYSFTDAGIATQQEVKRFLDDHIYPNEEEYYKQQDEFGPSGYPPIMPSFKGQLREEDILQLIAYLKSLPGGSP